MGPGDTDATTAAAGLRLIQSEFTVRPRTGDTDGRTATRTTSAAPLDLGTLDYLRAHVDEVIAHTRTHAPGAPPAPHDASVYAWMDEHTAHLEEEKRRAGEALLYRHALENALKAGVERPLKMNPCLRCGCWGLMWDSGSRKAVCPHKLCKTPTGHPSTWTLAEIAYHHISARENAARRAT